MHHMQHMAPPQMGAMPSHHGMPPRPLAYLQQVSVCMRVGTERMPRILLYMC